MKNSGFYAEQALAAFNAGFRSKAAKNEALANLNKAYRCIIDGGVHRRILDIPREERTPAHHELYWALPSDLHQWREKHAADLVQVFPEAAPDAREIQRLLELRDAIRVASVVPHRKTDPSKEARTHAAVQFWIDRRRVQYAEALRLGELFGGLPVTATAHYVTNQYGTAYPRVFYYLGGKLTPLAVIIAAAEALETKGLTKG